MHTLFADAIRVEKVCYFAQVLGRCVLGNEVPRHVYGDPRLASIQEPYERSQLVVENASLHECMEPINMHHRTSLDVESGV